METTATVICEPTVLDASKQQESQAKKGGVVFLGNGTRDGWTGELPFYLFRCPGCKKLRCDYSHGWPKTQYVSCHKCGTDVRF